MIVAHDLMTPDPFAVRDSEPARTALSGLLTKGLHGAPVVDSEGKLVGVVSVSDLSAALIAEVSTDTPVRELMSAPAVVALATEGVYELARSMVRKNIHRLVITDESSRPIGVLSPMDILRGIVNMGSRFRVQDGRPSDEPI